MSANLIIGSSHAMLLAQQAGHFQATWQDATADLLPIETHSGADTRLLFVTNRPEFMQLSRDASGRIAATFGPMMDKVRAYDHEEAQVLFAIGGNEHNMRFLCADPKPFDFHHPAVPGLDPDRQILPLREMQAVMHGLLERTLAVTRLIAEALPRARRYYLPPPPPIASEAQIRTNPAVFDFDRGGIEDPRVRLKLYALYLEAVAGFSARNGLVLLPPPPEACDEAGFLAEPFWEGSTHATPAYYAPLIAELGL